MSDGVFPGVEELSPETQAAIEKVAEELGVVVRRRCCMPSMARAQQCKWRHRPVTASIRGSLPGLTDQQVKDTYREALRVWNSVCNVGLQWTDDFSAANIWADCRRIDGSSGTLAWSYLIQCGSNSTVDTQLEQRYDNGERWTRDWLLEVALHELGHALGLDHINNQNALMNPTSAGGRILVPTRYELEIMVPLYGEPVGNPAPGVPTIRGGVLLVDGGVSVGVDAAGQADYSGRKFKVGMVPL